MKTIELLALAGSLTLAPIVSIPASAAGYQRTFTGTLSSDDAVVEVAIDLGQRSNLSVATDSYGGGVNLDGTTTVAGGFVPIVALFSPSGAFIADDGGDVVSPGRVDPATGFSGDAAFSVSGLAAGDYTLAITEFPNYPNGSLADGFFEAGQGNFTAGYCGQSRGAFLQVDLVSCPQRTDAYTLNVSGTGAPEPAAWALMTLGVGLIGARLRKRAPQPA